MRRMARTSDAARPGDKMKTNLSASILVSILLLTGAGRAALGATGSARQGTAFRPAALAADATSGFLDVTSDPAAKIAIDGVETGKTTPQLHLALVAGHHKLTLVTVDGARQRTIGFTVEAGQTTKLSIHLTS